MADGTNVYEPQPDGSTKITPVDSAEVDFGGGDVRDRQRIVLSGNSPTSPDVFVKTATPGVADPGLVVRQAGVVTTQLVADGTVVGDLNRLPTNAHLRDASGAEYTGGNRLPVDIGTATITASFKSVISTTNTRTIPLAANENFTGPWEEVTDYSSISLAILTDQGTPMDGAAVEFSTDAANVVTRAVTTFGAVGGSAFFTLAPQARYFRVNFTNGPVAQTVLRAEVTYHFNPVGVSAAPIGGPADDRSVASLTKATLHGRHSSGFWAALRSTIDGILSVNVENILRSRGENSEVLGVLTAASQSDASQSNVAGPSRTVVQMQVPEGHSSTQIYLYGTFSSASQVFFEGSADGTDQSWFSLNQRRNTDATTNDESSTLDAAPFGGPSPTGAGLSNWRGSPGGVKFFRVRCGTLTPGDAISVKITTSTAGGPIFQQGPPPLPTDRQKSGTLTGPNQTVSVSTIGTGAWAAYMSGTFTGTVFFEGTIDNVNWSRINGAVQGVGTLQTQLAGTNAPQTLQVRGGSGGVRAIRLRASADFAGTFNGVIRAGAGTGGVFMVAAVPIAGLSAGAQSTRVVVGSTTAVRLDPSALAARTTVEIQYIATGAANGGKVYVGFTNAVTSGSGRELSPGESWTLDVTSVVTLFGRASNNGQEVQITEIG